MAVDLQAVVDSVGSQLRVAVVITDKRIRSLAHNSHHGEMDDVRQEAILAHEPPPGAREWVMSHGILNLREPLRIGPRPEISMGPRICIPIRANEVLLGWLWLLDRTPALTEDELQRACEAAEEAAVLMYRDQLLDELGRSRVRELLRELLSDDDGARRHAVERIRDEQLLTAAPVTALVASVPVPEDGALGDSDTLAIELALDKVARHVPRKHSLQLVRRDHGVMLITGAAASTPESMTRTAELMWETLTAAALTGHREGNGRLVIGVGSVEHALVDAVRSYRHALQAIRVASVLPADRSTLSWHDLGIYRMLVQLPMETVTRDALHPGFLALAERGDADVMIHTLESYLDLAGDAQATAKALNLHRTSLYYRLKKIEELGGVALRSGEDRLALHLSVKLARLMGAHPETRDSV